MIRRWLEVAATLAVMGLVILIVAVVSLFADLHDFDGYEEDGGSRGP